MTSLSVNYTKTNTYIRRTHLVFIIEPTATCFGFLTKPDQAAQELQIIVVCCITVSSKPLQTEISNLSHLVITCYHRNLMIKCSQKYDGLWLQLHTVQLNESKISKIVPIIGSGRVCVISRGCRVQGAVLVCTIREVYVTVRLR